MAKARTILHLDMDAFFAAVEQRDDPSLRGKPVVIGADPRGGKGRGVVATCSYEARKFGIHSAMPIATAYRRCPGAVFMAGSMHKYVAEGQRIRAILRTYSPLVEPLSIDEAFVDMSGTERLFGAPPEMAARIKAAVRDQLGLACSVGIAPNKFLAKIASDLEKPDGLVIVPPGKVAAFLAPLDIRRMWGVGPKTERVLRRHRVRTFADLQRASRETLSRWLGPAAGAHFRELAHGIDDRPVEVTREVKSVSNEHTFSEDTAEIKILRQTLLLLADKVARRLRRRSLAASTAGLKLRFADFTTLTRSVTLQQPTNDRNLLFAHVWELFERVASGRRKIRLLGVRAAKLAETGHPRQLDMFADACGEKEKLTQTLDGLQERFGEQIIAKGIYAKN